MAHPVSQVSFSFPLVRDRWHVVLDFCMEAAVVVLTRATRLLNDILNEKNAALSRRPPTLADDIAFLRALEEDSTTTTTTTTTTMTMRPFESQILQEILHELHDDHPEVPTEDLGKILVRSCPFAIRAGLIGEEPNNITHGFRQDSEPSCGVVVSRERIAKALVLYRILFIDVKPKTAAGFFQWVSRLQNKIDEWQAVESTVSVDPQVTHTIKRYVALSAANAEQNFLTTEAMADLCNTLETEWRRIVLDVEYGVMRTLGEDLTEGSVFMITDYPSDILSQAVVRSKEASVEPPSPQSAFHRIRCEELEYGLEGGYVLDVSQQENEEETRGHLQARIDQYKAKIEEIPESRSTILHLSSTSNIPRKQDVVAMQKALGNARDFLDREMQPSQQQCFMHTLLLESMWERLQSNADLPPVNIVFTNQEEEEEMANQQVPPDTPSRQIPRRRHRRRPLSASEELYAAMCNNDLVRVQQLSTDGVNPNMRDSHFGQSPLHEAAYQESIPFLEYYVGQGMDPWDRSRYNELPLHLACYYNKNGSAVEWLLNRMGNHAPADWEGDSFNGRTPLHNACLRGYLGVIQYLFDHFPARELLNLRDSYNLSPWHYAFLSGHDDVVNFLVRHGASTFDQERLTRWLVKTQGERNDELANVEHLLECARTHDSVEQYLSTF